jgi:hypothetical protein
VDPDDDRLRSLLAALRERSPSPDAERQVLATFDRVLGPKDKRPSEPSDREPKGCS